MYKKGIMNLEEVKTLPRVYAVTTIWPASSMGDSDVKLFAYGSDAIAYRDSLMAEEMLHASGELARWFHDEDDLGMRVAIYERWLQQGGKESSPEFSISYLKINTSL